LQRRNSEPHSDGANTTPPVWGCWAAAAAHGRQTQQHSTATVTPSTHGHAPRHTARRFGMTVPSRARQGVSCGCSEHRRATTRSHAQWHDTRTPTERGVGRRQREAPTCRTPDTTTQRGSGAAARRESRKASNADAETPEKKRHSNTHCAHHCCRRDCPRTQGTVREEASTAM
jgi:hypothetical protein